MHRLQNLRLSATRKQRRRSRSSSSSMSASSPQFHAPYPIELTFFHKPSWHKSAFLAVTDIDGNVIFEVESRTWSLRNRQVVFNGSGKPVVSMKEKLRSLHDRWQVFTGDGSDPKHDLLFTVKRTSAFQHKTELDVFLAANTKEELVDFKINGSYKKKTCTVYKGADPSIVVAQMSKEYKCAKGSPSEQAFGVTVNPSMDCSFITALVIILGQLDEDEGEAHSRKKKKKKTKKAKIAKGGKKGERKEGEGGEGEEEEEESSEEEEEEEEEEEDEGIAEIVASIAEAIFS